MEDWEETHIDKNLPILIKNTKCTTLLKIILKASGIVTDEEVETLTAAGNNHGAQREAKALYDILKTRRGAYEALMNALEETRQTGSLDILKAGKSKQYLEANEDNLVQKFMEIRVELFGSVQSLQEHVPDLRKETVVELLNSETVKRELAEVLQSCTTLKLDPDPPEQHALYIPRAISNRLLLDPVIFKRNCSDIFVFQGVDRCDLVDLVYPHALRMSNSQLSSITCRHIHLDDDEDWDDLVLKAKAPLHLVYKDTDGYILQRSTQVTSILHEHWLDKTRNRDAYLSEEKFVSQLMDEKDKKGALVCDVPGMGKTWLMRSIARRAQILSSRTVVFFIQLDFFAKYLTEQNKIYEGVDTVSRFLQFHYHTELEARILRLFVEKNDVNLVFVLDGFDEVSHVYTKNLTLFLKNLVGISHVRFVISSRPNMRAHLEASFNLISFDILPFGKQEQVASIVNRWKETILEGDKKKLTEFAVKCINSLKIIMRKDRKDILGVPLQCYLLATVNETTARQVCNPKRQKEFVVNDVAKVESICGLYTLFFNSLIQKGNVILNNGATPMCCMQSLERFHTRIALELLFPEIAPVVSNTFRTETAIEDFATKLGMLCQRQSKLEFIHRSIAEFLAGKFFAEFWMDIKAHDPSLVQSVGSFFIINVIKPTGHNPIRLLSYTGPYPKWEHLSSGYPMHIPEYVVSFSCNTILWFMNSLYRIKPDENDTISIFTDTLSSTQRLLPVWKRITATIHLRKDTFTLCKEQIRKFSYMNIIGCVYHGFSSLLCLIVSFVKVFFRDTERLALLRVQFLLKNKLPDFPFLLCYIAAYGSPEDASQVFDLFGGYQNLLIKFCMNYPERLWTPLEVAIARKNLEMVLFFNQKVKKNEERLLKAFLEGEKYTNADMNVIITIMETVFECASKFFSCLSVQKFELFDRYVSVVNLTNLAWACKCSLTHASTENKKSFLEIILERGTDAELIKLLLLLFPNEQNKRFCVPDESMTDFSFNISKCTRKAVLQNVSLDDIKMAIPNDLIHISRRICNVETIMILIGISPNFSSLHTHARNYLHEAVRGGKVEWVEHLIECGYDIDERDRGGNTPLHYVWQSDCGVEMTQTLANKGPDVYAVNNDKRNFAHDVCSRIK